MKRLYLRMIISNKILLFPITILSLYSCNSENEVNNVKNSKTDSTQTDSVDTLDSNEVIREYNNYPTPIHKLTDTKVLLSQIKNNKVKVLFHGIITEPFLDVYLTEKELLIVDNGNDYMETFLLKNSFDKNKVLQVIDYENSIGTAKKLDIIREPSGDGMSDRTYPYKILIDDRQGGGDCKRMVDWSEYDK